MSFPSWSVWQTCAKVILVAVFVWPLSHTFSALFNAKTFTLPLFLAFDRLAKNWFSSLPSERRLLLYIFWFCFAPKRLFVLLQLFHSKSTGAFVVVIQTGKGDFTLLQKENWKCRFCGSLCYPVAKKTCPQVEMSSTLRFSPLGIHNYPSWRCKKPNFYHNVNFHVSLEM